MLAPLLAAFAVKTAAGKVETLFPAQDRRATVVVYVLAECPVARQFSPELSRLSRAYRPRGIRFLMAFADAEPTTIRAQMKAFDLAFPGAKVERPLYDLAKPTTAPTAAVIASDGRLVYVGRIDDRFASLGIQRSPRSHNLRIALDQFLAGKPVTPARTPVIGCAWPTG